MALSMLLSYREILLNMTQANQQASISATSGSTHLARFMLVYAMAPYDSSSPTTTSSRLPRSLKVSANQTWPQVQARCFMALSTWATVGFGFPIMNTAQIEMKCFSQISH